AEAREAIDRFVDEYNDHRPHRSLDMLSPSQWLEKIVA
ncbi:integrase core domain-containing protein, partial [Pseudobacteriovorax antillogorgiicola]